MRLHIAAMVAASAFGVLADETEATPLHPSVGLSQAMTRTIMIKQARTVCRRDPATNRRVCIIDRSQPPTVCHWVRDQNGNIVRDCY
jgi:hypothetical protein